MNEDQEYSLGIGLIIISICIGNIYSAVYGWLVLGSGIILITFLSMIINYFIKKRKLKNRRYK
jgi:purine-cytosine permease-like protein